ncbi:MAG: hypothetical protein LC117_03385 [Bacteroidia bacterium]|nr:hypothetical protein [Bacteroidia bacterium]MCZ2276955.1 hypothetical protein [Bacteroidia bacterium]
MKQILNTRLILTACLLFFLISCKKYTYYEFTADDNAWMIYSHSQQLKFINQSGVIHNYQCFNITRGYIPVGNLYNAMVSINFKLPIDSVNEVGKFQLEKQSNATLCTLTWPRFTPTITLTSEPLTSDTIGGTFYNDLIVKVSPSTSLLKNIDTLIYSKSVGVVKYTDINGNKWIHTN